MYYQDKIILAELDPAFAATVKEILMNCKQQGVDIQLRAGLRNTFTQAAYWRRNRSQQEVEAKIKELQNLNADFLAYCLFVVGEQQGPLTTNAIPGLSWHQYGLAVDCAWLRDGQVCWDNDNRYNGINGYEILAKEAEKLQVQSGHYWTSLRDSGHLQAPTFSSPLEKYSLEEINQLMQERYLALIEKI